MAKRWYPIVVERGELNYGVYAPDFLGCISTGHTVEETVDSMQDALQGFIELMQEDHDPLPEPTPFTSVEFDPSTEVVLLVPVEV